MVSQNSTTFCACVAELVTPTTSPLYGERNAIQSFLADEIVNAAAAIAFLKEEYPNNPYIEQEITKYLRENGLQFDVSENYGEPLSEGTYKVKHDIEDLDGEIIINKDEDIEYNGNTDTVMGYDVFKYKNTYLTTEDLYANT